MTSSKTVIFYVAFLAIAMAIVMATEEETDNNDGDRNIDRTRSTVSPKDQQKSAKANAPPSQFLSASINILKCCL